MEVLFLLIPISFLFLGGVIAALYWSINDGQYDDLEGPPDRIVDEPEFIHDDK